MKLLAQDIKDVFGGISPPPHLAPLAPPGSAPGTGISNLLDNVINIFFGAAAVAFIIMFVWGAVQMILSGGDKEAVAKARSKLTWAIIGVVIMALSYTVFQLLEEITGFKFFV